MLRNYVTASALVLALSSPAFAQGAGDFRLQSMQANAFEIQSAQIALSKSRNPRIRGYAQEAIRDHRAANVALAGGERNGGPGGLIGAPLAVAGGAVGAGVGAATGAVGGTLSGGPVGAVEGATGGAARGAAVGSGAVERTGAGTIVPPSPEQQAMLAELSAAPAGPRFDRLYVSQQLQSHQMAIGVTQAYAQGGPSPALRGYAQQVLPTLQEHYAEARRLPGAM